MDQRVIEKYKSPAGAASYNVKYEKEVIKRWSNTREYKLIKKIFDIVGGGHARMMDLPSGTGRLFRAFQPYGQKFFETDVSREMLKLARVNLEEFKPNLVQASAFHIPYKTGAFDCVFSARLTHHIPEAHERDLFLGELCRVSNKWVVVTFFHTWSFKNMLRRLRRIFINKRPKITMTTAELREVAKRGGMEVVTTFPLARFFSGHHYAILKKIYPMVFHGSRLVVQPEFERLFKAQGIERVEDVAAKWAPGAPPDGERSRVAEVRLPNGHFFVKTYHYAGGWRLRTLFIPARVRREYENLLGLARLGMKVSRPVAYGESRTMGFMNQSFLVTEAIENAIDLRELYAHPEKCPFPPPTGKERRDLITTFARALRRCHDAGWFIHTLFFKNLLLTCGSGGFSLWLIDVPFAHIWRNRLMPDQGRIRDFATLAKGAVKLLSKTERIRFCRAYGHQDHAFLRDVEAYRQKNYPDSDRE